jgi:hypothetical protein
MSFPRRRAGKLRLRQRTPREPHGSHRMARLFVV